MSESQLCSGQSWHGRMGLVGCCNKATSTHDGKPYCHVHDPVRAAARRDKANAKWRVERDAKDRKRKLDEAVRLTADAVLRAADAWMSRRIELADACSKGRIAAEEHDEYDEACRALEEANRAHRKAKAEQAKERAT